MSNNVIENHKRLAEGWFQQAGPHTKGLVAGIVASYVLRTGRKHNDGSIGEVRITPLELHDLLTYVMVMTKAGAQAEQKQKELLGEAVAAEA